MCYSTKRNILGQTIYTVTHARSCQIMQGFFPPSFNSKAMCYLALFPWRSPNSSFSSLAVYASNQKLEPVCKQSKTGGCMQAIKDWRLYAKTGGGEGLHDAMWYLHWCLAVAYCKRCKHYLCNVEGMPPVVIGHRTVILLHRQQPPVKHLCTCEWGKCILIKCTKTVKQLIQVHTHCIAIH